MSKKVAAAVAQHPDPLVPDPVVWRELGISSMSGWRWTHDPDLDFPPPIKIRNRCFRSRRALEEFKARQMRRAIAEHSADAKRRRAKREGAM
jgi:predicted DNA-binding transcriptional regulator AlpA